MWFIALTSLSRPGFESMTDKLAEMSYASSSSFLLFFVTFYILNIATAVQGKDALVEKFRNSPVMLNHHDNRPKVSFLSLV